MFQNRDTHKAFAVSSKPIHPLLAAPLCAAAPPPLSPPIATSASPAASACSDAWVSKNSSNFRTRVLRCRSARAVNSLLLEMPRMMRMMMMMFRGVPAAVWMCRFFSRCIGEIPKKSEFRIKRPHRRHHPARGIHYHRCGRGPAAVVNGEAWALNWGSVEYAGFMDGWSAPQHCAHPRNGPPELHGQCPGRMEPGGFRSCERPPHLQFSSGKPLNCKRLANTLAPTRPSM